MEYIVIRLLNRVQNRFQVIGRGLVDADGSRSDMSTTFFAANNNEFKAELNKLKNEYRLFTETIGKNSKNEVLFKLTA